MALIDLKGNTGLADIFLKRVILSPISGTLVLVAFSEKRYRLTDFWDAGLGGIFLKSDTVSPISGTLVLVAFF